MAAVYLVGQDLLSFLSRVFPFVGDDDKGAGTKRDASHCQTSCETPLACRTWLFCVLSMISGGIIDCAKSRNAFVGRNLTIFYLSILAESDHRHICQESQIGFVTLCCRGGRRKTDGRLTED